MEIVYRGFLFPIVLLLSEATHGRIVLRVNMVYHKGIDQGPVLYSELHTREQVYQGHPVLLKIKNGPQVAVRAKFLDDFSNHGPSAHIEIEAQATSEEGTEMKSVTKRKMKISIGEKKSFRFKRDDGRLLEVGITPGVG